MNQRRICLKTAILIKHNQPIVSFSVDGGTALDDTSEEAAMSTDPKKSDTHQCTICNNELRNSRMLRCRHLFCLQCLTRLENEGQPRTCTVCGLVIILIIIILIIITIIILIIIITIIISIIIISSITIITIIIIIIIITEHGEFIV